MHPEILNKNQEELLNYLKKFKRSYYLLERTTIALHIGHRRSIDFDLFTMSNINKKSIYQKLDSIPFVKTKIFED